VINDQAKALFDRRSAGPHVVEVRGVEEAEDAATQPRLPLRRMSLRAAIEAW